MDLVADIGATNARFQLCAQGKLLHTPIVLPTNQFADAGTLVAAATSALGARQLEQAALAIAGPAQGSLARGAAEIKVTNSGLLFNAHDCAALLGCSTTLVNDFYALAHGVPYFKQLVQIGGSDAADGAKAVLGPGSGLGMATLIATGTADWRVLASEGGHADLAPGSHLEAELWGLLMTTFDHVSWETVLCGSGLQHLYAAMCVLWGAQAEDLTPVQISSRGIAVTDPVCHQTLETFCGLLGAVAGNFALTVAAVGGVYIAGGIVPQILDFVRTSPLRRRFDEHGAMSAYVEAIPVFVVVEANPGLQGAVRYLEASRMPPPPR